MTETPDIRQPERAVTGEAKGCSLHSLVLQPVYDVGGITIYCGDNRKILPLLDDYDLLLTDPPYGIGVVNNRHGSVTSIKSGSKAYGRSDWDNATPPEWVLQLAVAKAKWQIIWGGNYFGLPPSRGWLVWDKGQRDFSLADAELAWTNLDAAVRVMTYARGQLNAEGKVHPTQKPEPLMSWCLNQVPTAKTICDPWMGSGTTLVAAKARGLRAIGIEANETYCRAAVARLAQDVLGLENARICDGGPAARPIGD